MSGVAHTLPDPHKQQLVVDIGGGSTEFIIGKSFEPLMLESLYMGCVGFSLRYFPNGTIDKRGLKEAGLAARASCRRSPTLIARSAGRKQLGSSGSAKALLEILEQNGLAEGAITLEGTGAPAPSCSRRAASIACRSAGSKADRLPVLFGALRSCRRSSASSASSGWSSPKALRLGCSTTCSGDTIITICATRP